MIQAVIFDMYETLVTLFSSPTYFGTEIAKDLEIDESTFFKTWDAMELERSIGKMTLEELLTKIMQESNCYDEILLRKVVEKRISVQRESFTHLHPEIIGMLKTLKSRNLKIGLISNCFSEEAKIIRQSMLYPYFDAVYLSYEQGIQKPDHEIYYRCMHKLNVTPANCIYVGDGGSFELEAAKELAMQPLQATWYLKEGTLQPSKRKAEYVQMESPSELLKYI